MFFKQKLSLGEGFSEKESETVVFHYFMFIINWTTRILELLFEKNSSSTKKKFMTGVPLLVLLEAALLWWCYWRQLYSRGATGGSYRCFIKRRYISYRMDEWPSITQWGGVSPKCNAHNEIHSCNFLNVFV